MDRLKLRYVFLIAVVLFVLQFLCARMLSRILPIESYLTKSGGPTGIANSIVGDYFQAGIKEEDLRRLLDNAKGEDVKKQAFLELYNFYKGPQKHEARLSLAEKFFGKIHLDSKTITVFLDMLTEWSKGKKKNKIFTTLWFFKKISVMDGQNNKMARWFKGSGAVFNSDDRRSVPFLKLFCRTLTNEKERQIASRRLINAYIVFNPREALTLLEEGPYDASDDPMTKRWFEETRLKLLFKLGEKASYTALKKELFSKYNESEYSSIVQNIIHFLVEKRKFRQALGEIDDLLTIEMDNTFYKTYLLIQKIACLRSLGRNKEAEELDRITQKQGGSHSWLKAISARIWESQKCPLNTPREGFITFTGTPPVIDGTLNDSCWQKAPIMSGFIDNTEFQPVWPQTLVSVCYDKKNLYIACLALEEDFSNIRVNKSAIYKGDSLEFFIWDEGRAEQCNQVIVSPEGDLSYHQPWHGKVVVATGAISMGWIVEIMIPAKSIGRGKFSRGSRIRLNFNRNKMLPKREWHEWSHCGRSFLNKKGFGSFILYN